MTNPLAFILLRDAAVTDLAQLEKILRARHPSLSINAPKDEKSRTGAGTQAGTLLTCAGKIVSIMSVAAPLPKDEGLVTRTLASWPAAPTAFQQSNAHLIVAVLGQQDQLLTAARVTTAVAGALLSVVPNALGVIWGGGVASPSQRWAELSKTAFAPYPQYPATLWVSLHPFRDEQTGGVGVLTQGLNRFIQRELELIGKENDLQMLMIRAEGLAAYLIENGPVLKDGSTFGFSETERMSVQLCNSTRFPGIAVISGVYSSDTLDL